MRSSFFFASFFFFISLFSSAQEPTHRVAGTVADESDKTPLVGATIMMINIKDSTRSKFAVADGEGKFVVDELERAFYKLRVSNVGYVTFTKLIRVNIQEMDLKTLLIKPDPTMLDQVTVETEVIAVQQLGDTTQYNAAAFKTNPDASASDLVSKMPGIVVDSDGVTANGESIEQVLLDGKRFFGQDPLLSLNTIPAEVVDKVQVFDEASDQSRFTGFDDGNTTKTMNVVTKEDKRNGQFGKVYAGVGENELYKAGVTLNSFSKEKRLTFLGMSNNINQQNFGSEDLIGVGGGGGRVGFRRGGNQNFITGTQDGITNTNSTGINFTDDWGKNITFEGSYFFNHSNNTNDQILNRESFLNNTSQFYSEEQQADTENFNHRLNLRMDYKINDQNNLLIRTGLSHQDNESEELTIGQTTRASSEVLNGTFNRFQSMNDAFNFNNNLIFQHKFEKIGRTVSLNINTRINPITRDSFFEDLQQDSLITYSTKEDLYTIGSAATYTEPVGTAGQIAIRYEVSHTSRESDTETFSGREAQTFIESLSNTFESEYTKHVPSIRYSKNQFGNIFNVALAYQDAQLKNNQVIPESESFNRSFRNLLPSVMARFEVGSGNAFLRYATTTTEPSVSQLQNVLNNSDPLFLSIGNPELVQTYSHSLIFRLQKNSLDKNITFANLTRVQASQDYISTGTSIISSDSLTNGGVRLVEGAQVSMPINLDGYWLIRNNSTFGKLIPSIKNNLNISFGLTYRRLPGMTNEVLNISNTYSSDINIGLASNISEKVDYNVYYQINGSRVSNSIQSENDTEYYTQTLGTKLNLIFWKGFVFRNETYFQKYNGVNDSFDTSYTLWNMGIAKKFLKNNQGEFELSVFDLLGNNQSFDQTVTPQYVEESQTQVLQRYFMLTFTYQIRNFR